MLKKANDHSSSTNVSADEILLLNNDSICFDYLWFDFVTAEKKLLELAEKYKELKKSGKVEKFLAKKRKKQLGKDSKHLNKNEHIHYV